MQKVIIISLVLLSLGIAVPSFAYENSTTGDNVSAAVVGSENQAADAVVAEPVEAGNELCLISGEKVGEMGDVVKQEYKGKIYNFCCKACLKDFDKDPEKYIKAYEEKEASNNQAETTQQNK